VCSHFGQFVNQHPRAVSLEDSSAAFAVTALSAVRYSCTKMARIRQSKRLLVLSEEYKITNENSFQSTLTQPLSCENATLSKIIRKGHQSRPRKFKATPYDLRDDGVKASSAGKAATRCNNMGGLQA